MLMDREDRRPLLARRLGQHSFNLRTALTALRNSAIAEASDRKTWNAILCRMSQSVVEADHYSAWLNVRDRQRPVGPYQLLGLQPLESGQSRIQLGYEQQIDALRRVQNQAS